MTRWGMAVDMAHCVGCQTCVVACQMHNALRPGVAWLRVDALEWGAWPDADRAYFPHACLHCDEPDCVSVCPTGASSRRPDGIVEVDYQTCIGCGVCMTACPFGARTINGSDTWFFGAEQPAPYETADPACLGVAEKCDFCAGWLDRGLEPACVESCPVGVRAFGDVDNPDSEVSSFIRETGARQVAGTALWYAPGERDVDLDEIARSFYAPAGEEELAPLDEGRGVNPGVLSVASVVGVGTIAGIGLAVRRDRRTRAGRATLGGATGPEGPRDAGVSASAPGRGCGQRRRG